MTGTSQSRILTKINQNHLENEVSYIGNAVKMGASTAVLQNLTANIPLGLKDVTSIQIVSSLTFCVGIVHVSFILCYLLNCHSLNSTAFQL